ncbi:MAG: hypothetical protein ACI8YQ_001013 [Polaribacter sp.]|jgi:hypothetical protein
MAFPLSKIELHIDDALIVEAEKLLKDGRLSGVTESDPGLWIAVASDDNQAHEVEVLLTAGKVKAHTCECGKSDKKQYCVHIVSLLLYVITLKKKVAKSAIKKPKEIKVPRRITLPYVLELCDPKDLKEFMIEYASQDRNFGILLKAHFAHLLPRTEDNEPIGTLLANSIKAIKKPGKTMSRNDWKMMQKVLHTFLKQAEDALYKKHYADVFETTEAILQLLSPMLLLTEDRKVFSDAIVNSLLLLRKTMKANLAPELENEIWRLSIGEAKKRVYYFYDLWQPLGDLLLDSAKTKKRSAQFLEVLEEKSQDNYVRKHPTVSAGIVNFKIQLFELQHNEAALKRYLEENISHPEVLKQAIQLAAQNENWAQLEQLCKFALSSNIDEIERTALKIQLLAAYRFQKKKKKVGLLAQELFLETYDLDHLKLLKKNAGKKWPERRATVLIALNAMPNRLSKTKVLALLYAQENLTDELRRHLKESLSLDLLREFDELLFQQDTYKTASLYKEVIDHYLENYVGRPAAIKVRESIRHLFAIKENGLAHSLMDFMKEKYGDRGSLLEAMREV